MSKKKKETRTKKKKHKEKTQTGRHKQVILNLLDAQPRRGLTLTQIIRKTGAKKKEDLKKIERFIDSLLESGRIRQLSNGSFVPVKGDVDRNQAEFTGVVDHVSS